MADVTNFEIGGVKYNVKDSTARQGVQDNATEIEKLKTATKSYNYRGAKAILIGDSFNGGFGGTDGRGWGYYMTQYMGLDSHIIQQYGGGFWTPATTRADYPNSTFQSAMEIYAGTLSQDEKESIELIVTGGGYNDGKDSSSAGDSDYSREYGIFLRNTFPNAKLIFIAVHNAKAFTMKRMNAYKKIVRGAKYGTMAAYFNSIYWFYGRDNFINADGTHFTDQGYQLLAQIMTSVVQGGSDEAWYQLCQESLSFKNGYTQRSGNELMFTVRDGICHVSGAVVGHGGAWVKGEDIFTCNKSLLPGGSVVVVWLVVNTGEVLPCTMTKDGLAVGGSAPDLPTGNSILYCDFSYPIGMTGD